MAVYIVSNTGGTGAGTLGDPWSISHANDNLDAGDTAELRGGNYTEEISPINAGSSGSNITYKPYLAEIPTIISTTSKDAIRLTTNYVVIDGINTDGQGYYTGSALNRAVVYDGVSNCIVKNGTHKNLKGWQGVWFTNGATYNTFKDCVGDYCGAYDGGDGEDKGDFVVIDSDCSYNKVLRNSLAHGGHNLLECEGQYNIIKWNIFDGSWVDTEGAGAGNRVVVLNPPGTNGYNLFENNICKNVGSATDPGGAFPMALKADGTNQIVRNNIFINNIHEAVSGATRDAIQQTVNQKVYNNLMFNCGGSALVNRYYENDDIRGTRFKNNVAVDCGHSPDPENTKYGNEIFINLLGATSYPIGDFNASGNTFFNSVDSEATVFWKDVGTDNIAGFEASHPTNFSGNSWIDPGVTLAVGDPADVSDISYSNSLALIGQGVDLTTTNGGGSGTTITLHEAGYFCDGFNNQSGDPITIGNENVLVTSVNYATNVITIDRSITWIDGASVNTTVNGTNPGPYMFFTDNPPPPIVSISESFEYNGSPIANKLNVKYWIYDEDNESLLLSGLDGEVDEYGVFTLESSSLGSIGAKVHGHFVVDNVYSSPMFEFTVE